MSNDRKESLASAPTLLRALALIPNEQEEFHSHPHHIMLPLDADAKNILGAPSCFAGCYCCQCIHRRHMFSLEQPSLQLCSPASIEALPALTAV